MRKPLSSCFDCVLLKEPQSGSYWCGGYDKPLTYEIARTPNDCPRKQQNEEDVVVQFPREEILARFYETCCTYAEKICRPFTMRELFDEVNYMNKNSLWELLELLVKAGKIDKADGTIRTWQGAVYKVKTYWPKEWSDAKVQNVIQEDQRSTAVESSVSSWLS